MSVRVIHGDCRTILPTLDAGSFDCIVTSPPYWGLRDYGVDGQIGLEPTLDAYVETMASLGDELWLVLKPGGTFWLNLGDSYSSTTANNGGYSAKSTLAGFTSQNTKVRVANEAKNNIRISSGLKPKDLCGVPWRVAFALQSRGWWLRSAIVWAKPNPMPESVTDRPTSAYEMVFLLTKAERYFYDAGAISEEFADERNGNPGAYARTSQSAKGSNRDRSDTGFLNNGQGWNADGSKGSRNARNIWTIAPQPYRCSHFATMPPDLAERCIKAGCPRGGSVLDPFGGAGTTGLVADRLGRSATLIELNPTYADMGRERIRDDAPLFAEAAE